MPKPEATPMAVRLRRSALAIVPGGVSRVDAELDKIILYYLLRFRPIRGKEAARRVGFMPIRNAFGMGTQ
jgi:hypothetical protein